MLFYLAANAETNL